MDQFPPDSQVATASQFTESAFAVPVDRAMGAATSAPPIAAIVSFLRRFFNIVPFATLTPKAAPTGVRADGSQISLEAAVICRGVAISVRHDRGGSDVSPEDRSGRWPARSDLCQPHSHAGFVSFGYLLPLGTNWTVRSRFDLVTSAQRVTLFK